MTGPLPPAPDPDGDHATEPLAGVSMLMTAATAITGLAVAFGAHVTPAQAAGIVGAVGAVGTLAVWLWGRRKTWSPASVASLMAARGRPAGPTGAQQR